MFGRDCEDCSPFYADASFINLTSSYGLFIGLVLISLPWLLMVYSSTLLRNHNLKIQMQYIALYSVIYSSVFIHYQFEIQPTQLLFYLSAVLPSILLAKTRTLTSVSGVDNERCSSGY